MANEQELAAVIDKWIVTYNAKDIDNFMTIFADTCDVILPEGRYTNKAEVRTAFLRWFATLPNDFITVDLLVTKDPYVTCEWTSVSTNTGPIRTPGGVVPATNKTATIHGVDVVKIENGLIVEERMYFDRLDYYIKIGLVPSSAPPVTA